MESNAIQEGHSVQNKQDKGQKRDNPLVDPPSFPFLLLSLSPHPLLPLLAALLTTGTAALITPL